MTIVINYQKPTSRDFTGENVGVRLTRADKQAIVALRDLLRPTVPMANYSRHYQGRSPDRSGSAR